jgi:hypothetical protein
MADTQVSRLSCRNNKTLTEKANQTTDGDNHDHSAVSPYQPKAINLGKVGSMKDAFKMALYTHHQRITNHDCSQH